MKFSVITIHPQTNSTFMPCGEAPTCWESLVLGVEYLFMGFLGFGGRNYGLSRFVDRKQERGISGIFSSIFSIDDAVNADAIYLAHLFGQTLSKREVQSK